MYTVEIKVLIEREKRDISLILEMVGVLLKDISEGREYQVTVKAIEEDE